MLARRIRPAAKRPFPPNRGVIPVFEIAVAVIVCIPERQIREGGGVSHIVPPPYFPGINPAGKRPARIDRLLNLPYQLRSGPATCRLFRVQPKPPHWETLNGRKGVLDLIGNIIIPIEHHVGIDRHTLVNHGLELLSGNAGDLCVRDNMPNTAFPPASDFAFGERPCPHGNIDSQYRLGIIEGNRGRPLSLKTHDKKENANTNQNCPSTDTADAISAYHGASFTAPNEKTSVIFFNEVSHNSPAQHIATCPDSFLFMLCPWRSSQIVPGFSHNRYIHFNDLRQGR